MSYRTANQLDVNPGSRGVTHKAFKGLDILEFIQNPENGTAFDLVLGGVPTLAVNDNIGGYAFPSSAGGAVGVSVADDRSGCMEISTDSGDNDVSILKRADFPVRIGADATGSFAIAARVAVSSVSDTNFLFGFAVSTANSTILTSSGVLGTQDFVGFQITEANDTTLRVVHKDGGSAVVVDLASAATVAADTFINLAIRFNKPTGELEYYVDNVLVATVTASTIAAAGFPDDADMVPVLAVANGAAASRTLTASAFRGVRAID